ncbi:MAG: hypothetical protein J2P17_32915, partial [Mycobacterium sp.]|nr:hypothetical protein [Mycobacterium sp.]
ADRKPNAQGWTELSREIGTPCVITDAAAAAERDKFLKAVQANPELMPAPTVPPGPHAFSRPGDQHAGAVGPQARIRIGARDGLFDDLVGHGFLLITVDPAISDTLAGKHQQFLNQIGARIAIVGPPGTDAPVIDVEGTYSRWLAEMGRTAALVRPDFYLYGAASGPNDLIDLVDSLATHMGARI